MGREWERSQRDRLVQKQRARLAELSEEVAREKASDEAIKKKSGWES